MQRHTPTRLLPRAARQQMEAMLKQRGVDTGGADCGDVKPLRPGPER